MTVNMMLDLQLCYLVLDATVGLERRDVPRGSVSVIIRESDARTWRGETGKAALAWASKPRTGICTLSSN